MFCEMRLPECPFYLHYILYETYPEGKKLFGEFNQMAEMTKPIRSSVAVRKRLVLLRFNTLNLNLEQSRQLIFVLTHIVRALSISVKAKYYIQN